MLSILCPSDVPGKVITPQGDPSQQDGWLLYQWPGEHAFFLILRVIGLQRTERGGEALEESPDEVKPVETCPSSEPRAQSSRLAKRGKNPQRQRSRSRRA